LARKASKETLARDRAARLEQQTAASIGALVKLIQIVNGVGDLHRTIEAQIAESRQAGDGDKQLWQRVIGVIGLPEQQIRFETDELAVLVAAKEFDYLPQLMLAAARYATLVAGFRDYTERRRRLLDEIPARMNGNVGTIILTEEEMARYAPRAVELEMQITDLRATAAKDRAAAAAVAEQFGPKIKKQLGLADFPRLSIKEAGAATPAAAA
jgi:hypothetical protein